MYFTFTVKVNEAINAFYWFCILFSKIVINFKGSQNKDLHTSVKHGLSIMYRKFYTTTTAQITEIYFDTTVYTRV